jgi:hypothetical protein
MNHPYEQLADLVDGTLDEGDLAGVQAHLDTCASCREDVAHATAGREAARSLPQATAPADLHRHVIVSAGGRGNGAPIWYRWAAVAAAAAVVVAIAIALPNVGGGGDKRAAGNTAASAEAQVDAGGARSNAGVTITVEGKNYDEKGLQQLVSASASLDKGSSENAAVTGASADPAPAVRCVKEAAQDRATGRLVRLIQARFEGRAAYIAIYLEGPGAGQQPDLVAAWVASRDNCSLLSLAFSQI